MRAKVQEWARQGLRAAGLTVSRTNRLPEDLDRSTLATIGVVRPYTMSTPEQINAMCQAVGYVVANRIPGDIVECGVWRGGNMMAAARTLGEQGETTRRLHLFDTFEGMVPPGPRDRYRDGSPAIGVFDRAIAAADNAKWCDAGVEEVQAAMSLTGYPEECINYLVGRVEDTLPRDAPEQIAILRLDTDWYESTRHELAHLYPRLAPGGVLIIDDYGYWQGVRQAVDEHFAMVEPQPLLIRVDYSARMAIVPGWPGDPSTETEKRAAAGTP
jgi:hypothetical protein